MRGRRMWITIRLLTIRGSIKRAQYLKKCGVFAAFGDGCSYMPRKLPLYPNLIKIGNRVSIASNVGFLTHDAIHHVLNRCDYAKKIGNVSRFNEKVGCIEIGDNVFIGSGTRLLYDVRIGTNVIIGTGSIVNKDVPSNSVVAGIPAKVVGTYEDFIHKRIDQTSYPSNLSPSHEVVSPELSNYLWESFYKKRNQPEGKE